MRSHVQVECGRRDSGRVRCAVIVLLVAAAALPALASPNLSSPRAVFDSFLGAMVDVKAGSAERIDDAVACLDLAGASGMIRGEGPRVAGDLKTYLDKTERIDLESIPDTTESDRWVYRRVNEGEISVVRGEDGNWRFSAETIDSLPALVESVRGRDLVAGLEGGEGVSSNLADAIRGRLPGSMLKRVLILENWQWLALLALAFAGIVADRIVRLALGGWLRRMLAKSESFREKGLDESFARPVGILVMSIVWWLFLPLFDLPLNALAVLRVATRVLMSAAAVWGVYRLIDVVAAHFGALAARTDTKLDDILIPLLRRAVKVVTLAFVILFVAQNLNVDITSLLAGLGIGGIAFALAAKDTVENLFGSITVLVDRPFQIGDWVAIGDHEGTVEEMGFRSTRVRTFYNSRVTIPNSHLVNSVVDNFGARSYRRFKCMISVQYDTPPDRIDAFCEGVRELIRKHPYTRKDYYMVYLNQLSESSLNILLYVFHEAPDWPTELRERHRLLTDIIRLAHGIGVEFAFPTQTLHLASAPEGVLSGRSIEASKAQRPAPAGQEAVSFAGHEEAVRLGRVEAERILQGMWKGEVQAPVAFDDPDRIRTGTGRAIDDPRDPTPGG